MRANLYSRHQIILTIAPIVCAVLMSGVWSVLHADAAAAPGGAAGKTAPAHAPAKGGPPLGGAPRALKLPPIHDVALPNGLQVRVVEDHRFPLVTTRLAFRFGTSADPAGSPGLCAATSSLLKEGTLRRTSREIADELASIGGLLEDESGRDVVALSGSALSEFAPRLLALLAEVVTDPSFPESELALRMANLKQELALNRSQPSWLAQERFAREVYGAHPYAVISPTADSIEALTRDGISGFHKKMFVPGAAVLVVIGDVDAAGVVREVTARFGGWKGETAAAPPAPAPPSRAERSVYLVDRPGSVQSDVRVGGLAIKRTDPLYLPAVLMDQVLGGGASSRLFLIVREEKGYAYDAHSELAARLSAGDWSAVTQVRTEVTKPALEEVIQQMERLRGETVPEKELQDAKNYLTGIFTLQVERPGFLAQLLAEQKIYGLPADELETYVARLNAVTAPDVRRAAQRLCDASRAVLVVVGDGAKIRTDLATFGPVSTFDIEGKPAPAAASAAP